MVQSNFAIERMLSYKEQLLEISLKEFTHPEDLDVDMPLVINLTQINVRSSRLHTNKNNSSY